MSVTPLHPNGTPGPARAAPRRIERAKTDGRRLGGATSTFEARAILGWEASRRVLAEPVEWVWEGIVAAHHAVELCGPSYTGKSTLAMLLLAARANPTGKPVELLGRVVLPMAEGKLAFYANEENGRQSAVAKIDASIEMLGLPLRETWDRIALLSRAGLRAYEPEPAEVSNPVHGNLWASLWHASERGAFGLLVLDTRARIFSGFGSPKDEDTQARVAESITGLVEASQAPVVVVSHTRKGAAEDIEDVSGSAQRGGGADTILMITADRTEGRVLSSKLTFLKLRDGVGEHPEPVTFSVACDETGGWRLAVNASARVEDQPAHQRVFELLQREGAMMKADIRKALNLSGQRLEQALNVLFAEKRVAKKKTTVRGREVDMFSARERLSTGETFRRLRDEARAKEKEASRDQPF